MKKFGYQQYKKVGVKTADRGKLLIMLYDGAIRFATLAKIKLEEKDWGAKGIYITKCQAIVFELIASLDHTVAPDLCKNLESLYYFMTEQLTEANIKKDPQPLIAVIKLLKTLREAWDEAVKQTQQQNAVAKDQGTQVAVPDQSNYTNIKVTG